MRGALACFVALGLVVPPAAASAAATHATVAHAPEAAGRIQLETHKLESLGEPVHEAVAVKAQQAVAQSRIEPERVQMIFEWLDPASFSIFIDVVIAARTPGAEPIKERATCRACSVQQLSDQALEHLGQVIALAEAADAEAEAAAAAEIVENELENEDDRLQPDGELDRTPAPGTIGVIGWSGVGLLVTGALTTATGGAFLGIGERPASNFPTKLRDFRPSGIALVVTGGVAIVTGAILLGLGVRRARRPQVAIDAGPGSAAVTISGRF
jgi:hypothetical protein